MRLVIPILLNCALVLGVYLADKYICSRRVYAVYSAQKYLPKAARKFIEILKKNL